MPSSPDSTREPSAILIVEDDYLIQEYVRELVEEFGYRVCGTADNAAAAVELARRHHPRIVLMDVRLKGERDGVDAACEIHGLTGATIIYMTGSGERATLDRIHGGPAADVLIKPVRPGDLRESIARAVG